MPPTTIEKRWEEKRNDPGYIRQRLLAAESLRPMEPVRRRRQGYLVPILLAAAVSFVLVVVLL